MSILQTTELKKYYGSKPNITKALDGVTLSIEDGEFVAIVGTSGSGKSTLLNMMGGLDTPTSGSIKVKGKELSKFKDEQYSFYVGTFNYDLNAQPELNSALAGAAWVMPTALFPCVRASWVSKFRPFAMILRPCGWRVERSESPTSGASH